MNYVIFLKLCDHMQFEINFAKSHHHVISDGLLITVTLGTEEGGHCREVERKVNVWTVCLKNGR